MNKTGCFFFFSFFPPCFSFCVRGSSVRLLLPFTGLNKGRIENVQPGGKSHIMM